MVHNIEYIIYNLPYLATACKKYPAITEGSLLVLPTSRHRIFLENLGKQHLLDADSHIFSLPIYAAVNGKTICLEFVKAICIPAKVWALNPD